MFTFGKKHVRLEESIENGQRVVGVYGMTLRYPLEIPTLMMYKDIDEKIWMRDLKDEYVSWSN